MKFRFFRFLFPCLLLLMTVICFSCSDSDENTDYVSVKPQSEYFFEAVAASDTLYIESSGHWAVSGLPAWIKAEPTTGNSGDKFVIAVEENESADERYAVLAITSGSATTTVSITQYGDSRSAHAVDLGLSVRWASFNVGATKPEEYGGYYAWGETEEKNDYSWETYKWCNGSEDSLTKYCTDSDCGTVDNKTVLDPEDDIAHVKWGGNWRMPTRDELEELIKRCYWKWTTLNGVVGHKVIGPNGNSIFLPAAGFINGTEHRFKGTGGFCWSSSLNVSNCSLYCMYFYESNQICDYNFYRNYGYTVRPVTE